ncbi:MAG: hypothetical protein XD57_1619 [Thermotoga petrophila]|uniref:Uncharacterized protein n=1 Tax=Thermotoga petrophila TaxID=93929 RepID=A0A101EP72_9THEM|nr:MAG: hypothetical protein XD57_1619 [Thermotoga petrophila]
MSGVKSHSSTVELRPKLLGLGLVEGDGTAGVGVKSVDISRNAGGEAGLLGQARR